MPQQYKQVLEVERLIGAEVHERVFNGETVECISIPIKENGMHFTSKGHLLMEMYVTPRRPNPQNITHYLSLCFNPLIKHEYLKIKEAGFYEQVKFIGHMFPWSNYKRRWGNKPKTEDSIDEALSVED